MEIFVDTSAHIALINKKDQYHQRAKDYYLKILSSRLKLVSTNFVICETITFSEQEFHYNLQLSLETVLIPAMS